MVLWDSLGGAVRGASFLLAQGLRTERCCTTVIAGTLALSASYSLVALEKVRGEQKSPPTPKDSKDGLSPAVCHLLLHVSKNTTDIT